jgi:centrin-3
MTALGFEPLTSEQVKGMITQVDDDGNGVICFEEFLAIMSNSSVKKDPMQEVQQAYALFDKDNKGEISLQDLRNTTQELGEAVSDEQLQVSISRHAAV